jgi:single-strand DNA-binding protein
MSINSVTIMGRLASDPELNYTRDGVPFCTFSLALERPYKNREGKREVDFVDVTAWRGTAEFVEKYFSKGDMLAVLGKLRQERWTTDDGQNRSKLIVVAQDASFCGSKRKEDGERSEAAALPPAKPAYVQPDEPMPWDEGYEQSGFADYARQDDYVSC